MRHLKMVGVAAAFRRQQHRALHCWDEPMSRGCIVESSEAIGAGTRVGSSPEFTTSLVNIICHRSTTELHVSGVTAAPETGTMNSLSITGCETTTGTKCEVTTQGFPASATLELITAPNGKLTVTPASAGSPGAKVVCGILINCTLTTSSATLTVEGENGASQLNAIASAVTLTPTGGICPKTVS